MADHDDHDEVHALLTSVAAPIDATAAPVARFEQRERLRRRRIAIGAPITAVVTVAAVVVAVVAVRSGHHPTRAVAQPPTPASSSRSAMTMPILLPTGPAQVHVGSADAATIATYHWRNLPPAPIAPRDDAAAVWTGSQVIVWGGAGHADGASYDPSTRSWHKLPAGPLAARAGAAVVWTGQVMFVWGGYSGRHTYTDGATYNPTTRTWTRLPASPLPAGRDSAYLIHGTPVVMSWSKRTSFAAYDVARSRWIAMPDLPVVKKHDPLYLFGLSTGSQLFVWVPWFHTTRINANETSGTSGVDVYVLDERGGKWRPSTLPTRQNQLSTTPLWSGQRILLPALEDYCGGCSGPGTDPYTEYGVSVDPMTDDEDAISHGPVSGWRPTWLWTGKALLGVDTMSSGGAPVVHESGEAAVWNPRTGTWTSLPRQPRFIGGVTVWTGASAFEWGKRGGLEFAKPSACRAWPATRCRSCERPRPRRRSRRRRRPRCAR